MIRGTFGPPGELLETNISPWALKTTKILVYDITIICFIKKCLFNCFQKKFKISTNDAHNYGSNGYGWGGVGACSAVGVETHEGADFS